MLDSMPDPLSEIYQTCEDR